MSLLEWIFACIIVVAALAIAGRRYRIYIKNRWKGLGDYGVACVNTEEKICALTFDDGPHPIYTPIILDTLKKYGIRATFFVVGKNAAQHPYLIRRLADEGHDIGNHTNTHVRLSHSSEKKTLQELQKTQEIIASISGQTPQFIRPPHGRFSGEQEQLVREKLGFPKHYVITWDVCTYDWEAPSFYTLNRAVQSGLQPGSIFLFHDVQPTTADHLDGIIANILQQGYTILSVCELLQRGTPLRSR